MIDRTIALAATAAEVDTRITSKLELMCEPQLSTVVFRYVPTSPDIDADRINAESASACLIAAQPSLATRACAGHAVPEVHLHESGGHRRSMEELIRAIVVKGTI